MKILIINGQSHKGSTYNIARILADKLNGNVKEIFLPKDFDKFCVGCTQCFMKDEKKCSHYEKLKPITDAMLSADVIILASPVYVYHATGAMKAWLDHYGYMWMVHRPEEAMFRKQAVCISTAAGAGMKSTNKDMADSLFFFGIPKIYKYGVAVRAVSFNQIKDKKIKKIQKDTDKIAKQILADHGKVKPGIKTKAVFNVMRIVHKRGFSEADDMYWKKKGWLGKKCPW